MRLGLFFTGISPAGGASNIWTVTLGGNLNLSITMTAISTLFSFCESPHLLIIRYSGIISYWPMYNGDFKTRSWVDIIVIIRIIFSNNILKFRLINKYNRTTVKWNQPENWVNRNSSQVNLLQTTLQYFVHRGMLKTRMVDIMSSRDVLCTHFWEIPQAQFCRLMVFRYHPVTV